MKKISLKSFKKYVVQTLVPAFSLAASVMLAIFPFSCRTSMEGIEFLSGDFTVPQVKDVTVADSNTLSVFLSRNVSVDDARIVDSSGVEMTGLTTYVDESENRVDYTLADRMDIGKKYVLDTTLEDMKGNSVTLSIDFLGYNDRVPSLVLSEIRTKNKSSSDKSEFVEIYALSSGNLSGLEIVSAYDGEDKKYSFPAIEVKKGEYIVVHMRNDTEGCVDELDTNLRLATTSDSSSARDLFAQNLNDGRFAAGSDIIAIRDGASKKILDCFVYVDPSKNNPWPESLASFSDKVVDSKAWLDGDGNVDCSFESAFSTTTLNRDAHTVCRRGVESLGTENPGSSAGEWYEVSSSKEQTPGYRN